MAFIDWSALGRQNWDVLVEALLFRMYDRDGNKVTIFNGIGGDGGRDVVVDFADGTKQIFQLKHFPGGFSGGFGKRRDQIDDSYKAAMQHEPDERYLLRGIDLGGVPVWYLVLVETRENRRALSEALIDRRVGNIRFLSKVLDFD